MKNSMNDPAFILTVISIIAGYISILAGGIALLIEMGE